MKYSAFHGEIRPGRSAIHHFRAPLEIIGVNPYVLVPEPILVDLFRQAGRSRGPIPIRGTVQGRPYTQTLVRYAGAWRLYVNTTMVKDSPQRVGEELALSVEFDPVPRDPTPPESFLAALADRPGAQAVFDGLPPYRRLEIVRYLARLKSEEALARNIPRALDFLEGRGRFVGRDSP